MTDDRPHPHSDAPELPADWRSEIGDAWFTNYWKDQDAFLREERRKHQVYPPAEQVFTAFHLTRYASTRVVILGQDPYHQPGEAHGLAFSVPHGVRKPPSVSNIHKELEADLGVPPPRHGNLESWAAQGVLLLNTALTVRHGDPDKDDKAGWATFTDRIIQKVSDKTDPVVFLLWGEPARKKKVLIDTTHHKVIESAHPKAWSNAEVPFLGSKPFSQTNSFLEAAGQPAVVWSSITQH